MVEIRQISEADIDGFHAALSAVAQERRYIGFLDAPPIAQTRAFCRRNIENGYPQLVALDGGTVIGWCDVTPPAREVHAHVGILGISLVPAWRGRGIGRRLLADALEAAWTFGFLRIELSVFSDNERARALYRKFGFVEEGVLRKRIAIDGVFHDEIIMALFGP